MSTLIHSGMTGLTVTVSFRDDADSSSTSLKFEMLANAMLITVLLLTVGPTRELQAASIENNVTEPSK